MVEGDPMVPSTAIPAPCMQLQSLIDEMRSNDFDSIRFATYRAACKLRFIQKKTNVCKVDIWNMLEAFRENGLNALAPHTQMKASRVELLLTTVFHNLNKRLVASQQIDTDKSISLLLAFLLGAYDKRSTGRLTVFSIKVALATICAGKLVEKLRYLFSQISTPNGEMDHDRFADLLQNILALTTAVFEAPTFAFSEAAVTQCFARDSRVTVTEFVETFVREPCPAPLMWLPLVHRMASVEHVYHPVQCDACQIRAFTGFRYKCQRCANYQLCQTCFWKGRTSGNHSNEHEMKEYSSYKSPTKQLAHSLHKSLQCLPTSPKPSVSTVIRPTRPPLDLSNVIPSTPNALRRIHPPDPKHSTSMSSPPLFLPGQLALGLGGSTMDDEHRLIARYAAKLSGRAEYPIGNGRSLSERCLDDRAMIAKLEEEKNEMLREMKRIEHETIDEDDDISRIRERKWRLEEQMFEMQKKRRQLMEQLEHLLPALSLSPNASVAGSAVQLPDLSSRITSAFRSGSVPARALQGDLLSAADGITTEMSCLVNTLHDDQLS